MNASAFQHQIDKAAVLVEALPYLQRFRGSTFLIKVGGSAMENPELVRSLLRDVVFLEVAGINPVIVHGGGKAISAAMEHAGLQAEFVAGLRVTTDAAMEIVERTLNDVINADLVEGLTAAGGRAVGVPGTSVFHGERMKSWSAEAGRQVELGRVGRVLDFTTSRVDKAVSAEVVPVISPVARELGTGLSLNVNADLAASALAGCLGVAKLVFLSDVRGVLRDAKDDETIIPSLRASEVEALISQGIISGGMIPKMRSSVEALQAGVGKVHMIDGRVPHSLLLELFTDVGIGTEIFL